MRALVTLMVLLMGATACADSSSEPKAVPAPTEAPPAPPSPRPVDRAWSQVFDASGEFIRAERRRLVEGGATAHRLPGGVTVQSARPTSGKGFEVCFAGPHGARLAARLVRTSMEGTVDYGIDYWLTRQTCSFERGVVELRWPEQGWVELLGGEDAMQRIPSLRRIFLEQRSTSIELDLDALVNAAEELRDGDEYPAAYDRKTFEAAEHAYFVEDGRNVDYRASEDRKDFQVCLQYADSGPWRSYDSAERGVVAYADGGRCSFDPPEPGSLTEVLLDVDRVAGIVADGPPDGCPSPETDERLVGDGVLAPGNRLAACATLRDVEGLVTGKHFCVQHGERGPWAAYYSSFVGLYASGGSGECDMRPPDTAPANGPWDY